MATWRRMQIDLYLSPAIKLNTKWIKEFTNIPDTMNLIEEKVGSSIELIDTKKRLSEQDINNTDTKNNN